MFEIVKLLCDSQGISVNELEDRCGLVKNSIYKLKDNVPKVDKLIPIADYFNVPIDFLVGRSNPEDSLTGLDRDLFLKLLSLTPEEDQKVRDYIDLLLSARKA